MNLDFLLWAESIPWSTGTWSYIWIEFFAWNLILKKWKQWIELIFFTWIWILELSGKHFPMHWNPIFYIWIELLHGIWFLHRAKGILRVRQDEPARLMLRLSHSALSSCWKTLRQGKPAASLNGIRDSASSQVNWTNSGEIWACIAVSWGQSSRMNEEYLERPAV